MVPIYEYRHHLDMVTTPFGAYFHILATDEFRRFQNIAWHIVRKLREPDSTGPGRLVSLDKWLHNNSIELDKTADKHWKVLLRHMRLLEAWGDFNQAKPAMVEAALGEFDKLPLMGVWVKQVRVNGFLGSYTKEGPTALGTGRWNITPATILEGRAVRPPFFGELMSSRATQLQGARYPAGSDRPILQLGNQDYRFIADLVASFNQLPDIESCLEANTSAENWEIYLWIFGLATWVALHTPPPPVPKKTLRTAIRRSDGDARRCVTLKKSLRPAQFSKEDFTERFDSSERATDNNTHSVEKSLEQISIIEQVMTITHEITNEQVASHFRSVSGTILANLERRVGKGYDLPSAVPWDGNPMTRIGADEVSLLQPYEAPYWVREWFRLRRTTFFRPNRPLSRRVTLSSSLTWITPSSGATAERFFAPRCLYLCAA